MKALGEIGSVLDNERVFRRAGNNSRGLPIL